MSSQAWYTALIVAIVAERLFELRLTRRHYRQALERGGHEVDRDHYPWMVAVHTAFLVSCPAEVWLADRPFVPALGMPMLVLAALAMGLRYWAVTTLGPAWSSRIVVVPGAPLVTGGPYRFLRHPNYLAVIVEIFALPMVHTAWVSALVFSCANAALLRRRIAVEESAIRVQPGFEERLASRPRLLPRGD